MPALLPCRPALFPTTTFTPFVHRRLSHTPTPLHIPLPHQFRLPHSLVPHPFPPPQATTGTGGALPSAGNMTHRLNCFTRCAGHGWFLNILLHSSLDYSHSLDTLSFLDLHLLRTTPSDFVPHTLHTHYTPRTPHYQPSPPHKNTFCTLSLPRHTRCLSDGAPPSAAAHSLLLFHLPLPSHAHTRPYRLFALTRPQAVRTLHAPLRGRWTCLRR